MTKIGKPRTTKGLAVFCAKMAQEKKAENIYILDLTKIETAPADYFVICSSNSDIQSIALADVTSKTCKKLHISKPKIEGLDSANWILLDFFDVVFHIMLTDTRKFYKLENLWGDAKFYELNDKDNLVVVNKKDIEFYK